MYTDSGSTVYRGQLMSLYLEIHLPDPPASPVKVVRCDIPWLGREFGFRWRMPPDQWFCQYSLPAPNSLACEIDVSSELAPFLGLMPGRHTIHVPRSDALRPVWKLSWQLVVDKPLFGEHLSFAPIEVHLPSWQKSLVTAPVAVTVQDIPPPLAPTSAFLLPPGLYRLTASCRPEVTYLGTSSEYHLCLSGSGACEDIEAQALQTFISQQFGLALHYRGETWPDAHTRCWRWEMQLKSAGTWELPSLTCLALDPQHHPPRYREVGASGLMIRSLPAISLAHLESRRSMSQLPCRNVDYLIPPWDAQQTLTPTWLAWFIPPILWFLVAVARWYRGRPFVWRRYSQPAKQALAALRHQMKTEQPDPYRTWRVLQEYLERRLALPLYPPTSDLSQHLRQRELDSAFIRQLIDLLKELESAAFSPSGTLSTEKLRQVTNIIVALDRQLADDIRPIPRMRE
ncbi:MAG: hypothetical protein NZM42_03020 [Gemmatales bacterium]|nr:hypothetical protein [Gemmatales bacterium]